MKGKKGIYKSMKTPSMAIERTAVTSKSKKLESSSEQLEILSVKADSGQVMIEFRAPICSPSSISGNNEEEQNKQTMQDGFMGIKVEDDIEFGEPSISVQSIPTAGDEPQNNYQTVHGGSTTLKVEDEVDIKIEDEMEFLDNHSISDNDSEDHYSQAHQDSLAVTEIDEIEPNMSTTDDELAGPEGSPSEQFVCDICPKKYSKKASLSLHQLRHHGKPGLHCTVCGVVKFFKYELIRHMRTHNTPEENKKLICDICSKAYSSKASLSEHRLRHGKPNLNCSVCGLTKFTQYEMVRHMRTHDTNLLNFACEICPKKFSTPAKLSKHQKFHDTSRKYFTCDICSEQYANKGSLNEHRMRHGKPNLGCSVCGLAKYTQYEMDRHMRIHDTTRLNFKCETCSKMFSSQARLTKHQKSHDTTCDICSKQYSSKQSLNEHRRSHKTQIVDCAICGVVKSSQHVMDRHMRTHRVYFPCDICPKKFVSQEKLSNHKKFHDNRLIYFTCDICSKQYGSKSALKVHRLRHDKPNLDCSVCGVTKFTQYEMERHMFTHDT